jgi:hypothetical protein
LKYPAVRAALAVGKDGAARPLSRDLHARDLDRLVMRIIQCPSSIAHAIGRAKHQGRLTMKKIAIAQQTVETSTDITGTPRYQ